MAIKYRNKRRKIDPGLYNIQKLHEKPLPVTRIYVPMQNPSTSSIRHQPLTRSESQHDSIDLLDTPPSSPLRDMNDFAGILMDESGEEPNSLTNPAVQNNSVDDVICLSENMIKHHRPIKAFDVISGRHAYTRTVIIHFFIFLSNHNYFEKQILDDFGPHLFNKWKAMSIDKEHS